MNQNCFDADPDFKYTDYTYERQEQYDKIYRRNFIEFSEGK
jgi:hypothetical protein